MDVRRDFSGAIQRHVRWLGVVVGMFGAISGTALGKSRYITIRVETIPSGAELIIDGRRYTEGGVTPFKLRLTPGTHLFVLEKRGYTSVTKKHKITGATTLVFELRALGRSKSPKTPAPSSSAVITLRPAAEIDPADTQFSINGKLYTRLPAQFPLQPGRYLIEVSKPNHDAWSRWIDVVEGQDQEIEVTMMAVSTKRDAATTGGKIELTAPKLPLGTGKLIINVAPNGAQVFVNGDAVGKAPWASNSLKAAVYQVRITHPGFKSWEALIEVRDGETSKVAAELRPVTPLM